MEVRTYEDRNGEFHGYEAVKGKETKETQRVGLIQITSAEMDDAKME